MEPGSAWGGEYSRWTFDEAKKYLVVAKEKLIPGTSTGVPLLDAELNEQAIILIYMLRRAIQHAFGDGAKGDGFKIVESTVSNENNFTISGGGGTIEDALSVFVQGWMPVIEGDLEYTGQTWDGGVSSLTTPSGVDRTDEVYIDVYYDEVSPVGDSNIQDPSIGFETSRRIRLRWKVKVAEGGSTPGNYTDGDGIEHWTLKLATLNRLNGDAQITSAMITDTRNENNFHMVQELTELPVWQSTDKGRVVYVGGAYYFGDETGWIDVTAKNKMTAVTKTSTYTANAFERVCADTSGGGWTLSMPASPVAGVTMVGVLDLVGSFDMAECALTISGNGKKVMGLNEEMICDQKNLGFDLLFSGDTYGWKIV